MARLATIATEVARGVHDADAEVVLPQPVHDDASGQRVLRVGNPLRERRTAFGVGRVRWESQERDRCRSAHPMRRLPSSGSRRRGEGGASSRARSSSRRRPSRRARAPKVVCEVRIACAESFVHAARSAGVDPSGTSGAFAPNAARSSDDATTDQLSPSVETSMR